MNNYGFKFEIPSFYILEAKVFDRSPKHFFRIVRFVYPPTEKYKVHTHFKGGGVEKGLFSDIHFEDKESLVLELMYKEDAYP